MKSKLWRGVGFALAALLCRGAGAAAQVDGTTTNSTVGLAGVPSAVSSSPNYVIGPNDRLRIAIWNQNNISGEYVVSGDGSFTFPLIGRISAAGLTLANLEESLKRLLSAGYFKNPQVTIAVVDYRSKRVYLMGALRQPGTYPLTGDMSLIEALARAGSTTPDAAGHVFIIRTVNGDGPVEPGQADPANVTRVDLREFDGGQLPSQIMVQDGETIFVPRAATAFVYGLVRSPGSYPIGPEMTVRQALALAGGISEFGAVNRVKILRKENGKELEIKVGLNDLVRPGDTIVVPERFF